MALSNLFIFNSKISSQRAFPWVALLVFLGMCLFEILIFCIPEFLLEATDFVNYRVKWKRETVESLNSTSPTPYKTLFMGECFGLTAFKPERFDALSSYAPSYNLCVYQRNTFFTVYFLLKKYLESQAQKPQVVCLEFTAFTLYDTAELREEDFIQNLFPFLGDPALVLEELGTHTPELSVLQEIKWVFPYRFPCWKRPLKGVFSRCFSWSLQKEAYFKEKKEHEQGRGYYPLGRTEAPNLTGIALPQSILQGKYSPYNTVYLEKILELLTQHQIPTVLLAPPVRKDALDQWRRHEVDSRYFGYLEGLQKRFPIIFWKCLDFVEFFDQMEDFQDAIHLHDRSAERFTSAFAQALEKQRAGLK
jgi:hypothetical protein